MLDGDSVDELRRAAALAGADDLADALAGHGSPVSVAVTGRPGVGKSAVVKLLAPHIGGVEELPGIDSPDHPDPDLSTVDVVIHVISGAAHPCDRAVLTGRDPATTVVAVARCDRYDHPADPSGVATVAVPVDPGARAAAGVELGAAVRRAQGRVELDRARTMVETARVAGAARPTVRDAVETFLRHPATSAVRAAC